MTRKFPTPAHAVLAGVLALAAGNAPRVEAGGTLLAGVTVTLRNVTDNPIQVRLQGGGENTYQLATLPARQARTFNVVSRDRHAYLTWTGTDLRGEPLEHLGEYTLHPGGRIGRLAPPVAVNPAPPPQGQPRPFAQAPVNHRITWEYDGGSFTRMSGGHWYEQGASGYERFYREVGQTPQVVELEATDGSGIRFRLYANRCHWKTPETGGWQDRAAGNWRPERRNVWEFAGGRFAYQGGSRWVETQTNYRREYRETDRCRDYVEIEATDGSGIGFRLYDNDVCNMRTPDQDWHERARGNWTR